MRSIILIISMAILMADQPISLNDQTFKKKTTTNATEQHNPDPDIILQGGDTVDDAYVITSIPFIDSGTTTGYTNDYDAVCPYSGSSSPDVVYLYSADEDTLIDISLCVGSSYDTKIYVYENTVGNIIACNDDGCPDYLSKLDTVRTNSGNDYFIIVDGYGGQSGNYVLDIRVSPQPIPPPTCDGSIYGQVVHLPMDLWSISISDAGFSSVAYDNFIQGDTIGEVKFWGFILEFNNGWFDCEEDPMIFEISIYEDNAGQPGNLFRAYQVSSSQQWSGLRYSGQFRLFEFKAFLVPAVVIESGWISIQGIGDPTDCWFLWMSGYGYNGASYWWNGSQLLSKPYDLSYCLLPIRCEYVVGDINDSGEFNGLDIIYAVNYLKGGNPPPYECECNFGEVWYAAGDINGSCSFNGLDITYGVSYFKGIFTQLIPCADCPPSNLFNYTP
ncbi:MAG: hypothetical protein JSU85_01775 [Candidatus Zixiibacteriota bacterium]|nr:MAG: hypothetical protein JSU85_01775 [candidate division Zixibacteria bacterium]